MSAGWRQEGGLQGDVLALILSPRVGLRAAERNIDELDTDRMAVDVRAALQLDPKGLERRMAKMLHATSISTGR